ncbi:MAG: hypothetical protein LBR93_02505 [Treponema sp.]|jgi:putative DNA primase/helicase|nr:hypothetical protein [Treponema sp.]
MDHASRIVFLLMVRNIHDELLRISDYRGRMEIEKHAMLSESGRRRAFVKAASRTAKM